MNRTIFSLLVLLLFGLFSQPSIAQSRQQASQRSAQENVAKMSEAEMRAHLPHAKARLKDLQNVLRTGNYSEFYGQGDDDILQGVEKAFAEAEYYYYTTLINEIEKRLRKIDSQKPKPQTEQQQPEPQTEQQQQEEYGRDLEKEWQKDFEKYKQQSEGRYPHTDVDIHSDATRKGNVAANLVRGRINTNGFTSVTTDMLDKQQLTRSNSRPNTRPNTRPNISDKIQKQKSEEPKKEEPVETPEETSNEYKEILELIYKLD